MLPAVVCAVAAKAEALRLAGNSEFKAGRLQEAMQQYSQAVQLLPSDALLYSNMSLVHVKLGCIDEVGLYAGPVVCPSAVLFGGWTSASTSTVVKTALFCL